VPLHTRERGVSSWVVNISVRLIGLDGGRIVEEGPHSPLSVRDGDPGTEAGLPTVCEFAERAHSGCLLGYGPDRPELRPPNGALRRKDFPRRRTGRSADRTTHPLPICCEPEDGGGTRPDHPASTGAELLVFEADGPDDYPPSVLARADEVIE